MVEDPWIDLRRMDMHDEGGQFVVQGLSISSFLFFFYIPLNVTSKGYRFLKVITRRIVLIILHRNGIGPFLIFAQMKEGSLLECRLE